MKVNICMSEAFWVSDSDEVLESALFQSVFNDNFGVLFGNATTISLYKSNYQPMFLKRKFSVNKDDWKKLPIIPEEYAGKEFILTRKCGDIQ